MLVAHWPAPPRAVSSGLAAGLLKPPPGPTPPVGGGDSFQLQLPPSKTSSSAPSPSLAISVHPHTHHHAITHQAHHHTPASPSPSRSRLTLTITVQPHPPDSPCTLHPAHSNSRGGKVVLIQGFDGFWRVSCRMLGRLLKRGPRSRSEGHLELLAVQK